MIKKAAISVLLLSSVSFNMAFANETENNSIKRDLSYIFKW